jgi:hypothetical protein
VSAGREQDGPSTADDPSAELSAVAERSRRRLHEEMERVRLGVEEMLAEQEAGSHDLALRRELEALREETRRYVKRRVRKSEKRLRRSVVAADERTRALERRIDAGEEERRYIEWRIHARTEQMLDGLLQEIRSIADLLTRTR